ncbi:MAG: phospho-N-acetylmuramoyl-pentapeptide-transferase, partial [Clostridia bacterium]
MKLLRKLRAEQTILHYVEIHKQKNGTPTMGGIIFLFATSVVAMCFVWDFHTLGATAIAITLCYAILGMLDDYIKIKNHQNEGLKPYQKIIGQLGIAIIVTAYCYTSQSVGAQIYLPFSDKLFNLGWWYIPLCVILFLASTNAVNLNDGLDGLVGKTA